MARRHLIKYANERNRKLGVTNTKMAIQKQILSKIPRPFTHAITIESYKQRWFLIK